MKVSVIITTYNRANVIPLCIESLLKQNFPKEDYEIIIVNNNSTDNTEEVVEKCIEENPDVNMKYYFVPRSGQVYARQIGILAAKNAILSFTDDDGILSPDWLKEIVRVFEMNPEVVGVAGKINIKWDETPPDWIHEYENYLGKLDYGNEIKFEVGLYMNAGNLSIKKNKLIEVGGFNPEMIGDWLVGDGETGLWHRLKKNKCLIGWTPFAVMEHCQIAKKNATTDDIKRRFMNNGICIPYNIFAINKQGNNALIKNMLTAFKLLLIWTYKEFKFKMLNDKKHQYYCSFRRVYYTAQIKYTMKIFFNKKFREAITKEDWLVKSQTDKAFAV